jgi:nucleoside-diphosphate-sugar epimerase
MRILVTGATGFIGFYLLPKLRLHHEAYALVRRQRTENYGNKINWIAQDLTKPLDYSRLPKQIDAIIHLAQSKSYRQFPDGARDVFGVNIHGTFQLLEYAREIGAKCFIFASTGGVYGKSYKRLVEKDPVNLCNFYVSSKYSAELLIANYQRFFRTVVFRFFSVYGSGQKDMLVPTLLQKVLNSETVTIEGNPGLRINPIYVEDAVRIFEPALHLQTSDLFNVAGDESVTISDLVKLIERISGIDAFVRHTDSGPQGDLVGDNGRMKEVLNVHPRVRLLEGLKRMV